MTHIILGIDPGSVRTGIGVIQCQGQSTRLLYSGVIKPPQSTMSERLSAIYHGLQAIIQEFKPHEGAIEELFISRNPRGALVLGQARGVALLALAQAQLMTIAEYSARTIKQSIVGYGAASKEQVRFMVEKLLNAKELDGFDATDALAVALCHYHSRGQTNGLLLPRNSSLSRKRRHRATWTTV